MLLPGTQMDLVTFGFVSVEIVILFYLTIYKLARPDDDKTILNIWLIILLLVYNIASGLLPDPHLPGSLFVQEVIAYGAGFIAPSYFPYYVYKAFGLTKMKFHAFVGVTLCLLLPFVCFVLVYRLTNHLATAENILAVPLLYGFWVIISLVKALRFKYNGIFDTYQAREERAGLLLSLTPWVSLPVIIIFKLSQPIEASVTNTGFLLLLGLQLKNHIALMRKEHQRLIDSEVRLRSWNTSLQSEVEKRTRELTQLTEQKTNTFINLAHETKTPLTLIKNYLDEYTSNNHESAELTIVKKSIDKLATDVNNLFDLEKFNRGITIYNHDQVTNISEMLQESLVLFQLYCQKRKIMLESDIQEGLFLKANPMAINRIINNLLENAIKFSDEGKKITVQLTAENDTITFIVADSGAGIPAALHKKVFEPYYQINQKKQASHGMGMGLAIVKKVMDTLGGSILIDSDPPKKQGTTIKVTFNRHQFQQDDIIAKHSVSNFINAGHGEPDLPELPHDSTRQTLLIVEDNHSMLKYLVRKFTDRYNVKVARNGAEAIQLLKKETNPPDVIICDVMMDKVDGFSFAKIVTQNPSYNHIPLLFLSARSSREDKLHGLDLGAVDFIQKPFSISELIKKVNSLMTAIGNQKKHFYSNPGQTAQSSQPVKTMTEAVLSEQFEINCARYHLTPREKAIIKYIIEGYKYKDIASKFYISERTVTKHVQNIFEKVNVTNKVELIHKLAA